MRKEIIEMLQNVIKTADSHNLPQTKVYIYNSGHNIAATDSKRLIKITLSENNDFLTDGFYDIAKVGKELKLVKTEIEAKFQDVERVIPADCKDSFKLKTQIYERKGKSIICDPKNLTSEAIAIFAAMQRITNYEAISYINIDFLLGIFKQLVKLTDRVELGYTQANYPVKFTAVTDDGMIEYVVMPMSKD